MWSTPAIDRCRWEVTCTSHRLMRRCHSTGNKLADTVLTFRRELPCALNPVSDSVSRWCRCAADGRCTASASTRRGGWTRYDRIIKGALRGSVRTDEG